MAELALAVVALAPPIIKYLTCLKEAPEERRELLTEISSTYGIVSLLTSTPHDTDKSGDDNWAGVILNGPGVEKTVQDILTILKDLQKSLQPRGDRDLFAYSRGPFKVAKARKAIKTLREHKQNLVIAMQFNSSMALAPHSERLYKIDSNQQQVLSNTEKILERDYSRQSDKTYDEAMARLSTYEHNEKHHAIANLRTPGTAVWIFQTPEYINWYEGTTNTLFLKGGPGVGKSYIASSIIDRLKRHSEEAGTGVAYYYLNYSERSEQSVNSIIRSFIKQLLGFDRSILEKLKAFNKDVKRHMATEDMRTTWAAQLLQEISNSFKKTYFILDAFDESEDTDMQWELSHELKALQDNCPQAKVLVTLRPGSSEYLQNFNHTITKTVLTSDINQDILNFVDHRIWHGKSVFLRRNVNRSPELLDSILATISSKCAGMFLLARLHMDFLAQLRSPHDLEIRLGSLTDQIEKAYDNTIKRLDTQEEENINFAKRVIQWVLHAVRPLKVNELLYALAIGDKHELDFDERRLYLREDIEDVCKGLIVIEQGNDEVQLVHHTVQEYFENRADEFFSNVQAYLANSCIKYLEYGRFARRFKSQEEIEAIIKENPFLQYAVDNFDAHERKAGQLYTARILKLLMDVSHHDCITQIRHKVLPEGGIPKEPMYTPLCTATRYNLPNVVKLLLDMGQSVNSRGYLNWLAPHEAAAHQRKGIMDMLLNASPPPDLTRTDRISNTILHALAVGDLVDHAHEVLKQYPDNINAQNIHGNTPLHDAVFRGHVSVAKLLIEAGANWKINNNGGDLPMTHPIRSDIPKERREGIVKLMLKAYYPNFAVFGNNGVTPLHAATTEDCSSAVKSIVQASPQIIDHVTFRGESALHIAATKGFSRVARVLIDSNANIDLPNKRQHEETPIYCAFAHAHEDIANMLLDAGVNIFYKAPERPLSVALHRMSPALIKRLLSDQRFDTVTTGTNGINGIHRASFWKRNEAALLYIEHDILHGRRMINKQDFDKRTPLMYAAEVGNIEIATKLMEVGADVEMRDLEGRSALDIAVENGRTKTAEAIESYIKGKHAGIRE